MTVSKFVDTQNVLKKRKKSKAVKSEIGGEFIGSSSTLILPKKRAKLSNGNIHSGSAIPISSSVNSESSSQKKFKHKLSASTDLLENGNVTNPAVSSPSSAVKSSRRTSKKKPIAAVISPVSALEKIDVRNLDLHKDLFPLTEESAKLRIEEWRSSLGITRKQASFLQKKYSVRRRTQERRRLDRIKEKQDKKVCYKCREFGHVLAECPQTDGDVDALANKCFKCGGMSHISRHCPQKHRKDFSFSKCFICSTMGHLARECPKNEKGAYPFGGACNLCGEIDHLIKDCPRSGIKDGETDELTLETTPVAGSADYEAPEKDQPKRKKAKIVKF